MKIGKNKITETTVTKGLGMHLNWLKNELLSYE